MSPHAPSLSGTARRDNPSELDTTDTELWQNNEKLLNKDSDELKLETQSPNITHSTKVVTKLSTRI